MSVIGAPDAHFVFHFAIELFRYGAVAECGEHGVVELVAPEHLFDVHEPVAQPYVGGFGLRRSKDVAAMLVVEHGFIFDDSVVYPHHIIAMLPIIEQRLINGFDYSF